MSGSKDDLTETMEDCPSLNSSGKMEQIKTRTEAHCVRQSKSLRSRGEGGTITWRGGRKALIGLVPTCRNLLNYRNPSRAVRLNLKFLQSCQSVSS